MSNTEGSDRRDMGNGVQKATTLDPVVVVEGKERMLSWVHRAGSEEHVRNVLCQTSTSTESVCS